MKMNTRLVRYIWMGLLSVHLSSLAESITSSGMALSGTLVSSPSCTIEDGKQIEVNFGNIASSQVDGVNYKQPLNYTVNCQGGISGAVVTLSLTAVETAFDANAVKTSMDDLGIRVYQRGATLTLFEPNSSVEIDPANPPKLEVVPVKKAGVRLPATAFDAWATLQADYQ